MAHVAFIGVGNMGAGMAANLVKAGRAVHAFDLSADALSKARDTGCSIAASAKEAAEGADAIVSMLPAGAHVRSVYEQSLFQVVGPATILIDCSTIDVATARAVEENAAGRGLVMVDAPVSGGIAAAQAGTLTFMVGGSEEGFARARPVLEAMGKAVIHAGGPGAGQAAKICNNMLLAASMVATCEAFVLAERLGLDAGTFFEIASQSSGQCWSLTSYCPVPGVGPVTPADRNYEGGFAAALMLKDLKLALEAAGSVGLVPPMTTRAAELYAQFADAGNAAKDFSGIIKMIEAGTSS